METGKKIFWTVASVALAALTVWAVLRQSGELSLAGILADLRGAQPGWLLLAALAAVSYPALEAGGLCCLLRTLDFRPAPQRGLLYGAADIYFSAITPSASGGQPASAYFMIRDGVPAGAATVSLLVNLILFSLARLGLGLLALICRWRELGGLSLLSLVLIAGGFLVLALLIWGFFAALGQGRRLFRWLDRFLRWLGRRRLLQRPERWCAKLDKMRADYETGAATMRGRAPVLGRAFLWNLGQNAAQSAVPLLLHLALSGDPALCGPLFSIQCLNAVGCSCVPIPGAMGAADFLMVDSFSTLLGRTAAFRLEMLSRGLSFYLCVTASGLLTAFGALTRGRVKQTARRR